MSVQSSARPSKQLCAPSVHSSICVHAVGLCRYPLGQTHAPPTRYGVAGSSQLRQSEAPPPPQVAHVPWQAAQLEAESAYVPAGQAARHAPSTSLGACAGQAVHCVAFPPLHSRHELSQGSQAPLDASNMFDGQEVTHVLPCLIGALVPQVTQSFAVPPEHVAQES